MPFTKEDQDAIYQDLTAGDSEYQPITGREIYSQLMISGMNILPINILTSYVTRGATTDEPLRSSNVSDQLLIEGHLLMVNDNVNGWHFENNIVFAEPGRVCQLWYGDGNLPITREYLLSGDTWTITDYLHYGTDRQEEYEAVGTLPAGEVKQYVNKLIPAGLLYPAQRTLFQIEGIYLTKELLADESIATNFFVNYGGSMAKLKKMLKERSVNKALPQGTELLHAGGSPLYDQLMRDERVTTQNYLSLMHLVIPDTLERVSGVAMRYSLTPQTNFVDKVRSEVKAVYRLFGVDIAFEKTSLKATTEILELNNSYIASYQAGAISQSELVQLTRELYQL